MKRSIYTSITLCAAFMMTACGGGSSDNANADAADSAATMVEEPADEPINIKRGNMQLYEADIAQEFNDAELSLVSPTADEVTEAGEYSFSFGVQNYSLASQTEGAEERHCANSGKGQHIHFIVNNGPYAAHYEPEIKGELGEGNNVILAFLSRSYHESIKTSTAHVLTNYVIGDVEDEFDESAEHLFYSRPKGTYSGKDNKKILFDFYLINAELSKNGYKVRATINEEVFILDKWVPFFIEGLPMGKNTFRIELIDALGEPVEGPFNDSGVREIMLEEEAPAA